MCGRQVLTTELYRPSPSLLFNLRQALPRLTRLALNLDPPASASQIAEIVGST